MATLPAPAWAASITYGLVDGDRAAVAQFNRQGNDLVITVTNTSSADALVPTDILTAIFFDIDGNPSLTRTSAVLGGASQVVIGGTNTYATPVDRVVGGEWAYLNGLNISSANTGVSSVGLGVFGPGDRFPGDNLQGPTTPDGLQYGITSAGDNPLTGNGGLSGVHLIRNSVVITLGGFSGEPDALISGVYFQYGTDLSEPRFAGQSIPDPGPFVPEPSSWALLAMAGATLGVFRWRRRR